jgi:hypothetical protein
MASRGHIRSHLLIFCSSPALAYSHKSLRPTHTRLYALCLSTKPRGLYEAMLNLLRLYTCIFSSRFRGYIRRSVKVSTMLNAGKGILYFSPAYTAYGVVSGSSYCTGCWSVRVNFRECLLLSCSECFVFLSLA